MLSVVLTGDVPEGGRSSLTALCMYIQRQRKGTEKGHGTCQVSQTQDAPSHIPAPVWLPSLACQFHNPVPFLMVPSRGNVRGVQYWGSRNEAGDQGGGRTEGLTCKLPAQGRPLINVRSLPLPQGPLGSLCAKRQEQTGR